MTYVRPLVISVLTSLTLTFMAMAQEKKIQRSDLPPAVRRAADEASKGAIVKGFTEEKEKGETFYEVEMSVNDHSKDVLLDPNGAIVEVEEEVKLASLPSAVKEGLQAKAGKGVLVKVESLRKHDQLVAYEAQVRTGARKSEVQVDPAGMPLDHEE